MKPLNWLSTAGVLILLLQMGCGEKSGNGNKEKGKSPTRREDIVKHLEEYVNFLTKYVKAPQAVVQDGKQTHFIQLVSEIQDVTVLFLKGKSLPVDRENRSRFILSFTENKRLYSLDDLYNFFKDGEQK